MAAQVAASHLGLDIYRVDLSQIMDKYIGETEKRLKEVFDQAEKSNMVLLFDEADALFSNRTDTGDAKEKHMNAQVSYLLQRIEEFTGIVLMTTNLVYQPAELLEREYYIDVDMSKYIALLIDTLNHDASISDLLDPYDRIHRLLKKYKDGLL